MPEKKATPAQKAAALRKVKAGAKKLDDAIQRADKARTDLDKAVRAARTASATYREIAPEAGRSVAWVQNSLDRT